MQVKKSQLSDWEKGVEETKKQDKKKQKEKENQFVLDCAMRLVSVYEEMGITDPVSVSFKTAGDMLKEAKLRNLI